MTSAEKTAAEMLGEARAKRCLSIKDIASEICVRSTYLMALEAGKYEDLPEPTFAIGFVRSYASALKLDVEDVVARYKKETGYSRPKLVIDADKLPDESEKSRKTLTWLAPVAGLVGVSMCWAAFGSSIDFDMKHSTAELDTDKETLAAVQAGLSHAPQDEAKSHTAKPSSEDGDVHYVSSVEQSAEPGPTLEAQQAAVHQTEVPLVETVQSQGAATAAFSFKAVEDTWIRLVDEAGHEVWSGILKKGDVYTPTKANVYLSTSNAGGVMLIADNSVSSVLGERGNVVFGLNLNKDKLIGDAQAAVLQANGSR